MRQASLQDRKPLEPCSPGRTSSGFAAGYLFRLQEALASLDLECLERMTSVIVRCYEGAGTVHCFGNGGSATTASHLAADFTKLTTAPGDARRLRATCLSDSVAAVTAAANDVSYDQVFVEQLRAFLAPGDVVLGISTSGTSKNVIAGLQYAASRGAQALAITGEGGAGLRGVAHETLVIRSGSVQRIEDVTLVAGHIICMMLRAQCHPDGRESEGTD